MHTFQLQANPKLATMDSDKALINSEVLDATLARKQMLNIPCEEDAPPSSSIAAGGELILTRRANLRSAGFLCVI